MVRLGAGLPACPAAYAEACGTKEHAHTNRNDLKADSDLHIRIARVQSSLSCQRSELHRHQTASITVQLLRGTMYPRMYGAEHAKQELSFMPCGGFECIDIQLQ